MKFAKKFARYFVKNYVKIPKICEILTKMFVQFAQKCFYQFCRELFAIFKKISLKF